jgi:hypothetical protein
MYRKMLREYVPELVEGHGLRTHKQKPPKNPLMRDIELGIKIRNKVAHGVQPRVDEDELLRVLDEDGAHCRPGEPLLDAPGTTYYLNHWSSCSVADQFKAKTAGRAR